MGKIYINKVNYIGEIFFVASKLDHYFSSTEHLLRHYVCFEQILFILYNNKDLFVVLSMVICHFDAAKKDGGPRLIGFHQQQGHNQIGFRENHQILLATITLVISRRK